MKSHAHQSVLLEESVDSLVTDVAGFYVDGTFGRGGHSREIISRLDSGNLISIDRDPQAIEAAKLLKQEKAEAFDFCHAAISEMGERIPNDFPDLFRAYSDGLSGVLFDLGVSSPQIDQADRGFSFSKDGPLDMRMDNSKGETAASVVASCSEEVLANIFYEYGDEKRSRRIAREIVAQREISAFETTGALASFIAGLLGWREGKQHPALRCFQALRIYVNQELDEVEKGIDAAAKLLRKGGRLVVISFHSLEDRIVKKAFNPVRQEMIPGIPAEPLATDAPFVQLGKVVKPSEDEIRMNPRSRSAIMRIGVRQ